MLSHLFGGSEDEDDDESMFMGILHKKFGDSIVPLEELGELIIEVVDGDKKEDDNVRDTTLFIESICSDGICRGATEALEKKWGAAYSIGGLSGFPFGGVTAVKDIKDQVPNGGDVFLFYAPHVGFSSTCEVGCLERPGREDEPRCCASSLSALSQANKELRKAVVKKENPYDMQQLYITKALKKKIVRCREVNVSYDLEKGNVHSTIYRCIKNDINHIFSIRKDVEQTTVDGEQVTLSCHAFNNSECKNFYVLGGVIINTPLGLPDFFLPKRFEVHTKVQDVCSQYRDLLGVFDGVAAEPQGIFCSVVPSLSKKPTDVWKKGEWKRMEQNELPQSEIKMRRLYGQCDEWRNASRHTSHGHDETEDDRSDESECAVVSANFLNEDGNDKNTPMIEANKGSEYTMTDSHKKDEGIALIQKAYVEDRVNERFKENKEKVDVRRRVVAIEETKKDKGMFSTYLNLSSSPSKLARIRNPPPSKKKLLKKGLL